VLVNHTKENKTQLAERLGISRGMLYYKHRRVKEDERVRDLIKSVLNLNPAYGHKRIALELKLNKKRVLRVMKLYCLKPYRRRAKKPVKQDDVGKLPSGFKNEIETFCPIRPLIVWVGDFTYFNFHGQFYYLATTMDLFTREVLGWSFSDHHNAKLVADAFFDGKKKTHQPPLYFHSDQGSEYDSKAYQSIMESQNTIISMSRKGHPWENGYQESFYSQFKLEFGDPNRFEDLGELLESISQMLFYYNHDRIHTSLKTSPANFRLQKSPDKVFKEMGT
jgi:transposase InsO family protein